MLDAFNPGAVNFRDEILLLLHDHQLRQELADKGAHTAQAYSWERTSEQYLELYEEVRALR